MRRWLLALTLLTSIFVFSEQAQAYHGHGGWGGGGWHHGGYGGWHHGGYGWGAGYRHWGGYRGWGYGGWGGYRGYGWGGYYRPYVNVGFYRPWYGYGGFARPYYGYGFYRPWVGVGYGYPYNYGGYGYPSYFGGGYGCYSGYLGASYVQPLTNYYSTSDGFYNPYVPLAQYGNFTPALATTYSRPTIVINRTVVRDVVKEAAPAPGARVIREVAPKAAVPVTDRVVSIEGKAKALKEIRLGDEAFAAGRYSDAVRRYLDATNDSPSYADSYFRKGYAYIALGQYPLAAKAFRKGLAIDPRGARDGFSLATLYGDRIASKDTHIENLAAAATMDASNADAYFLLGVMLNASGEADRAGKFFAKAASLSADYATPVATFLPDEKTEVRPVSVELGDEI